MNWPCSIVDLCLNNDIGRFYSFDLPPTREPCPTPPVVYRVLPAESMLTLVNCGAVVYACIFVCVLLRMPACFRYDRACVCVFMTRPVFVCLSLAVYACVKGYVCLMIFHISTCLSVCVRLYVSVCLFHHLYIIMYIVCSQNLSSFYGTLSEYIYMCVCVCVCVCFTRQREQTN